MMVTQMRTFARIVAILFLITVNLSAQSKARYSIQLLPQLRTPLGESNALSPIDMNDQGQVIGRAMGSFGPLVGFLFTPGQGMKQIDPTNSFTVELWRINNAGEIVGRDLSTRQFALFLYRYLPNSYTSITQGLSVAPLDRNHFNFVDFNDRGIILAGGVRDGINRFYPYRYTPNLGWQDVTKASVELKKFNKIGFALTHINDNGDFTFYRRESDGRLHTYVYYLQADTVIDLSRSFQFQTENDSFRAVDINDNGSVVGTFVKFSGPPAIRLIDATPYIFTPGVGMRRIRPPLKGVSEAFGLTSDGTVGGYLTRDGVMSIFVYNKQKGFRYVSDYKIRSLLPHNLPYRGVSIIRMNDRKEIAGEVYTIRADGTEATGAFYVYSPKYGLINLQQVLKDSGLNMEIAQVKDLNNRGEVLLELYGLNSVAVLSPLN